MDDIGLEFIERFAEDIVVMNFQWLEFHDASDGGMAKNAVEQKLALDLAIALLTAEAVTGS